MRETEKRIKEYEKALPHLKEKVAAAAMMLIIAVITMTASTFAWITISTKPEVKGIETTVSGNGNLEIALSDLDGLEPEESEVGDSGKNILLKNVTWGNLVNLSNNAYGLQSLTLRPATLNANGLDTNPLKAATYGDDGRVITTTSDFAYTSYNAASQAFEVPTTATYGVRAISSISYDYPGGQTKQDVRIANAQTGLNTAQSTFAALCDKKIINPISGIIGDYITCIIGDKTGGSGSLAKQDFRGYMSATYDLAVKLQEIYDKSAAAVLGLWNLKMPIDSADITDANKILLTEEDVAEMDAIIEARYASTADGAEIVFSTSDKNAMLKIANDRLNELKKTYNVEVEGYAQFLCDYYLINRFCEELSVIKTNASTQAVHWSDFSHIVNFVIDIPSTMVEGYQVQNIGRDAVSTIAGITSRNLVVQVQKGAIYNLEKFLGQDVDIRGVTVKVTMIINVERNGDITTTVDHATYQLPNQLKDAENSSGNTSTKKAYAQDTYGMAVDIWLRTNMEDCYLTLEGEVLTTDVQKTDEDGNLYYHDSGGNEYYKDSLGKYYDSTGTEIEPEEELLITYVPIVSGYKGENRVWPDGTSSDRSATQGMGSCYVFYTDSPTQQAQSLELMKAMKVAFVDSTGELLAIADMDTESYYAESGRVTVPLKLRSNSLVAGKNEKNQTIYAITKLERTVSTRITAILFVDGNQLGNSQVLSEDTIQGQINIQFGTSTTLNPMKDEDLLAKEVSITAEVSPTDFTYDPKKINESNVKLIIAGIEPTEVKATFIREINSSQGTRQDEITFTGSKANWNATARFDAPGEYILRTVWLDGVEYAVNTPQRVSVEGYTLTSIRIDGITERNTTIRTAETVVEKDIYLEFAGDDSLEPDKVEVLFMNENNQSITVGCTKTTMGWKGTIAFPTSGTYHMEYYLIDGEYYSILDNWKKTITLQMGVNVEVFVSPKATFDYSYETEEANAVNVSVRVADNRGVFMEELENLTLFYKLASATNLQTDRLTSPLTWNAETGFYEGKFQIGKPGAYNFYALMLEGSDITTGTAPTIRALPPDPPEYHSYVNEDNPYSFSLSDDIGMTVAVSYSNAASISAVIKKEGTDYSRIVVGAPKTHINPDTGTTNSEITDWYFAIPVPTAEDVDALGNPITQEGTWQITELHVANAYFDNILYDEENPMIWNMSDKNIKMNVVNDFGLEFVSGANKSASGQFLTSGKVSGLKLKFYAGTSENPMLVSGDTVIKVGYKLTDYSNFKQGSSSGQYYVIDPATENILKDVKVECEFTDANKDMEFDTIDSYVLPYPGNYTCDYIIIEITNGNKTTVYATDTSLVSNTKAEKIDMLEGMPTYSMSWTAPDVKFTKVEPEGTVTVNTGNGSSPVKGSAENSISQNGYTCNANMTATFGKRLGRTIVSEMSPVYVTSQINDAGNYSSANILFSSSETSVEFAFEKGVGTSRMQVGSFNKVELLLTVIFNRSTLGSGNKSNQLNISGADNNGTINYVFTINTLTLNNPY